MDEIDENEEGEENQNENPHCNDYDSEGRCNQCGQFDCYECDWGYPFDGCKCERCESYREAKKEAAKPVKKKSEPNVDKDLESMKKDELRAELKKLRDAIRYHRDQKGDDRCWVDDLRLYEALPEGPVNYDPTLPPEEVFLENCKRFCRSRQTPVGQPFKKDW